MFRHDCIRTCIEVSNACSHVECSSDRIMHITFTNDLNTTCGLLVTGDGDFPT